MTIYIKTQQGSVIEEQPQPTLNTLNQNVLICGTSGTGKSTLQREIEKTLQPQIKLLFKDESEKSKSIRINRPYLEQKEQNRVNFIQTWADSQRADSKGYMLIQEIVFIEKLTAKYPKLSDLTTKIEEEIKQSENIDKPILTMIKNRLDHLYPNGEHTEENINEGKVNLSGLTEDEQIFFSDYILQTNYDNLINKVISIDEIHRLTPLLTTTINRMTREIRSRGGLIATTQSLSDLPPALTNNFATIFLFQTIDKRDLEYLKLIDEHLPPEIMSLEDHEFLELRTFTRERQTGMGTIMEVKLSQKKASNS